MGELWRRFLYFINRRQIERELEQEMAAHRAAMADPASFGSTLKLREESNDAWGFGWFDRLHQDLNYASRILRRSPGFTLTAVGVLAFGIGLNVTAFGFLNTAMFRPLPGIDNPHTLMRLTRRGPESSSSNLSYPSYDFYRRHNTAFRSMLAVAGGELTFQETERWRAQFVSSNYFAELGVGPSYGHLEFREPGDIVIGATFFDRHFSGDPAIVGKSILLNRQAARIIGVAPAEFIGLDPQGPDVWALLEDHPHFFPQSQFLTSTAMQPLHLYGRLAPNTSPQAAEQAMRPVVAERRKQAPTEIWPDEYLPVEPGAYVMQGSFSKIVGPLLLAATLLLLVLLTACANLGNLLLARSVTRERELAIRTAVGATRGRIVRQLMTESIALALLGSAAGLILSAFATKLLVQALDWPAFVDASPDWRVACFAFGAGLLASIAFGLAPALQATRTNPQRAARLRLTLIGAQAAACCILLIVSALLLRGLNKAVSDQPGFAFEQSAVIDPDLMGVGRQGKSAQLYFLQLKTRLSQLGGIEATALATIPPLGQRQATTLLPIGIVLINSVDNNYFETMQIPILRGRNFRRSDTDVVILGERAASRLWPGQDPVGKQYTGYRDSEHRTVVGIAANAPIYSPGDPDAMEVYKPIQESDMQHAVLLIRARQLSAIQRAAQQAANEIDSRVIPSLTPMRIGMDRRLRNSRSGALAVSALGVVSLSLAVIGFAGLISFSVTQRTREIGIRLALGASKWQVIRLGLDRLMLPTAVGLTAGIAIAAGLAHLLRSQLYGLSRIDPVSFLAAPAIFLFCALGASTGPLSRAAKVAPSTALRHE